MSHKDSAHVVTPDSIHIDKDGTLFYYFSDALDGEDQDALRTWGSELGLSRPVENNLSIVVDIPTMVHDLLSIGIGSEREGGGYLVEPEFRPALDLVRVQLEHTLAMVNAVQYDVEPTAPDPEKCNDEVYKNGISLGFFDMTKQEAEVYCKEQTAKTGHLHDWHFIGGRVHVKALTTTK